jgi:SAM-dependent methyltransferase
MTEQASQFVGSIPEHYDQFLGPRIFAGFASDITTRVAHARPGTVLELAAGTGIVSVRLRESLPDDTVLTVTDLNTPMLDMAQQKLSDASNVLFQVADAGNLPFMDENFDAVVCQFGVMFFPDKIASYKHVQRVLKPGGRYIFNVWGTWESNPFARIAHEVVSSFFPANPPGFYKVPFGYNDEAVIRSELTSAGFVDVVVSSLELVSEIPSADDFASGLVFGNPLYDELLSRQADLEQIRSAISAAISRALGTSMPLQAFVIEARKGE